MLVEADEALIVLASAALMSYELVAMATHRPTVTILSHRRPYGFLIWTWVAWIIWHFITEAVKPR